MDANQVLQQVTKTPKQKRKANGQWAKGQSGIVGYEPGWIRKRFTADFLRCFHEDFQKHGEQVIRRVARKSPEVYLRCLTLLVPKEMKVEHQGGIKAMTDEQLDAAMAALRALLAEREAQAHADLVTPALPAPDVIDVTPEQHDRDTKPD